MTEWSHVIRLSEVARGAIKVRLEPDAAVRAAIAKELGLESLPTLSADLRVRPWLDGAEITGHFDAVVEQICGVSLDPFEQALSGDIALQVAPAGSPNATVESDAREIALDLDAPDPPDILEGDEIDLAAYVVEHLGLEIDPFPRKPGAEFEYKPATEEQSPFAVLKRLKDGGA